MTKSLYYHKGTGKTFEVDDAFAAKFVGLTKVEESPSTESATPKAPAKTKSSKEGTK